MWVVRYSFVLLLSLTSIASLKYKCEETLLLLHVIVRHGDRTPGTYPNDIYGEADYYPLGQGRLTEKGIERCYQVGRKLRSRYLDFLGSKYYYKEIEALSSSVPRCRVTMQAVLSTLYPKYSNELACSEGQLIDFDYVDPKGDSLISTYITCPKALEVNYTTVPGHVCENTETVRKVVSEHSGWEIYRPLELFLVYDTLKAQEEVGLKLPEWVKPIWPEPFHTCGRNFYQSIADDLNSRSHIAGNLLRKIVENTKEKLTDEKLKDRKLYLYTGHDMNLVTLLGSLGLYNNEEVSYAAYLAFEVHQINDVVGFKVYHENFEGSNRHSWIFLVAALFVPWKISSSWSAKVFRENGVTFNLPRLKNCFLKATLNYFALPTPLP